MGRPSVIPAVRERLERYLNALEAQYQSQSDASRLATLPTTSDGKVNVRAIARAIELKPTQEKYLFEREELSSLINLVAEGQGVLPIGARLLQDAGDKAVKERLTRQAANARAAAQAAVEAQAVHGELLERLRELAADNASLRAEVLRLRTQLDAIDFGMRVRVVD